MKNEQYDASIDAPLRGRPKKLCNDDVIYSEELPQNHGDVFNFLEDYATAGRPDPNEVSSAGEYEGLRDYRYCGGKAKDTFVDERGLFDVNDSVVNRIFSGSTKAPDPAVSNPLDNKKPFVPDGTDVSGKSGDYNSMMDSRGFREYSRIPDLHNILDIDIFGDNPRIDFGNQSLPQKTADGSGVFEDGYLQKHARKQANDFTLNFNTKFSNREYEEPGDRKPVPGAENTRLGYGLQKAQYGGDHEDLKNKIDEAGRNRGQHYPYAQNERKDAGAGLHLQHARLKHSQDQSMDSLHSTLEINYKKEKNIEDELFNGDHQPGAARVAGFQAPYYNNGMEYHSDRTVYGDYMSGHSRGYGTDRSSPYSVQQKNDMVRALQNANYPVKNSESPREANGGYAGQYGKGMGVQQPKHLDSLNHLYRQPLDFNAVRMLYGARKKRRTNPSIWNAPYLKQDFVSSIPPSKYSSLEFIQGVDTRKAFCGLQQRPQERNRNNYILPMILESAKCLTEEHASILRSYKSDLSQLDLENITVSQLKSLMKEYGLNHAGKKNELIEIVKATLKKVERFDLNKVEIKEKRKEVVDKEMDYDKFFF